MRWYIGVVGSIFQLMQWLREVTKLNFKRIALESAAIVGDSPVVENNLSLLRSTRVAPNTRNLV